MTRSDDELAALLALDALPADEQADAELRLGTFPLGYGSVAAALADGSATSAGGVPPDLRTTTLSRALGRRAPGRPVEGTQPCRPIEAYRRTVEDLRELLDSLTPGEWTAPAHAEHGSVHDLMAHLVGVERLSARWLTEDDVTPMPDHIASTRQVVDSFVAADGREITRQWHAATRDVAAAAAQTDPRRVFTFHDMQATASGFLIIRTFELWAHAMDISVATGRPLLRLDDERMAALSSRLMAALPIALTYRQRTARGRTMRFVLTGPAGGVYTVPLHPADQVGEPDAVLVADTTQLCLVAAQRLAPDELDATVDGDRELAVAVLAGIDGFARD